MIITAHTYRALGVRQGPPWAPYMVTHCILTAVLCSSTIHTRHTEDNIHRKKHNKQTQELSWTWKFWRGSQMKI